MNIESKQYKIENGIVSGRFWVTRKKDNHLVVVEGLPSVDLIAAMHESTFDRKCEAAVRDGVWPKK